MQGKIILTRAYDLSLYVGLLPPQAAELVLAHAASSLQWVGYLSSTSVYGDWGGRWVDERSEQLLCATLVGAHLVHAAGYAKLMLLYFCITTWHLLTACGIVCARLHAA